MRSHKEDQCVRACTRPSRRCRVRSRSALGRAACRVLRRLRPFEEAMRQRARRGELLCGERCSPAAETASEASRARREPSPAVARCARRTRWRRGLTRRALRRRWSLAVSCGLTRTFHRCVAPPRARTKACTLARLSRPPACRPAPHCAHCARSVQPEPVARECELLDSHPAHARPRTLLQSDTGSDMHVGPLASTTALTHQPPNSTHSVVALWLAGGERLTSLRGLCTHPSRQAAPRAVCAVSWQPPT